MKTSIIRTLLFCLLIAFVVQGCGKEYYYYQQHNSHTQKYQKRQQRYKGYPKPHHDRVDIRIRN